MPGRWSVADDAGAQRPEPSEEELLEQLEEEFAKLNVADVLVQTVFTVSSLGYRSLGEEHRDLDQARLAIEALRALVPVMKDSLPAEVTRDLDQLVANMQLAYAKAAT
jgi:hypothetical protein